MSCYGISLLICKIILFKKYSKKRSNSVNVVISFAI